MPDGWWSAAYLAAPVTLSTPSRRVCGWPMFDPCRTCAGVCERTSSGMGESSGNSGEGGTRERGQSFGCASSSERERPHYDPPRELDLEGVLAGGFCLNERGLGCATEERRLRSRADENLFRFSRPPRLQGDPAERKPPIRDHTRL